MYTAIQQYVHPVLDYEISFELEEDMNPTARKNYFLYVLLFAMTGCESPTTQPASTPTSNSSEIAKLTEKMATLEKELNQVKGRTFQLYDQINSLSTQWTSAEFDPTDSSFQRIDANGVGSFAVSVQDVRQFGDGVKISLNLGNLTTATIAGATLKLTYGPRMPDANDDKYVEKYGEWQAATLEKTHVVVDDLYPGRWNPVSVVLPKIDQKNLGRLSISISTSRIRLTK
jgi:Protein of unknown function (DUF3251)